MTSDGFKKIFIGLIFVFLDIVIFINWLPDFIGYILMLEGCVMLSSKEKLFKNSYWDINYKIINIYTY